MLKSFIVICLLLPLLSYSQFGAHDGMHKHHNHDLSLVPMVKWKFYGGIGAATYGGEVTGRQIIGRNSLMGSIEPRLSFTLGASYKLNDRVFIKAELGYYKIKAVENKTTSLKRGSNGTVYYFKANNIDFAVLSQFNLIPYNYHLTKRNRIVPFLLLGLGFTSSNPKVEVNKKDWESLNKVTDNQVKNKLLPTLPMGFGVLYRVNCQLDIGLEATFRYTLGNGSLDGDSKNGIRTNNLSSEAQTFFDNHYYRGASVALRDNDKFHDAYTNIQIRVSYTFIGLKYRHLFYQRDINNDSGKIQRHFNHHIRIQE